MTLLLAYGVAVPPVGVAVPLVGYTVPLIGYTVGLVGGPVAFSRPVVALVSDRPPNRFGGKPLSCALGASCASLVALGRPNAALAL